jgi:hypothetical protein
MDMRQSIRRIFHLDQVKNFLKVLAGWALTVAFDLATSIPHVEGFHEQNPYARHGSGEFWLKHALIQNSFDFAAQLALTPLLYFIGKSHSKRAAWLLIGLFWGYFSYTHLDAGYHNLMNYFGLYQNTIEDLFSKLF